MAALEIDLAAIYGDNPPQPDRFAGAHRLPGDRSIDWEDTIRYIDNGGDVNAIIWNGLPILREAVREGRPDVIRRLISRGADTELVYDAQTPLMIAAKCGFADCVAALLEGGADVNYCRMTSSSSALRCAVAGGSLRCVELLLASGADPNLCGTAALFTAIGHSNLAAVAALLKAGADVEGGAGGKTPLDAATARFSSDDLGVPKIRRARTRLIPMLLRAGATISPRNAARPSRQFLEDVRMMRVVTANVRITAAEELSTYLGNVLAAGSFAKYDASRRAPFVAMLERVGAFPIPKEMIAVVCAFWLRAGEY